ncbi:MAG: PhoH family protein, partial [Burkholderiales bacterium]|nr:PhoH family protein [Burkholderiales bacterium]
MPLPKMPTKPAALLSPKDYPKAEKGKPAKTIKSATPEKIKAIDVAPAPQRKKIATVPAVVSRPVAEKTTPIVIAKALPVAAASKAKTHDSRVKS